MRHLAVILGGVLLIAAPQGAEAQSGTEAAPKDGGPTATQRLQEGAAAIVEGLRLLIDQLQGYQSPEVLPNGDIIIRRRSPGEANPPAAPETPKGNGDKPLQL